MVRVRARVGLVLWLSMIASTALGSAGSDPATTVAPNEATIERLSVLLQDYRRARVRSGRQEFLLDEIEPSPEGLRYRRKTSREGATFRSIDSPRGETLSWSWIEKLEVRTSGTGTWVTLGAAAGLMVGLAVSASLDCQAGFIGYGGNCFSTKAAPVLTGLLVGAGTGAVLGDRSARWRTLYP